MSPLLRASSLLAIVASALAAGCAPTWVETAGPTSVFSLDEAQDVPGVLRVISALQLPRNAVVTLAPVWFVGHLHEKEEAPRIQVVARVHRDDGGTLDWEFTAPGGQDMDRWRPRERYRVPMPGRATDPVRVRDLVRLEVLVGELDVADGDRRSGVAAIAPQGAKAIESTETRRALSRASHRAGGKLELWAQVDLTLVEDAQPGSWRQWLVVAEADPSQASTAQLEAIHRLVPTTRDGDAAVVAVTGRPLHGMTVLALRLDIEVVDHTRRPPPGDNLEKRKDKRRDLRQRPWWSTPPPRSMARGRP